MEIIIMILANILLLLIVVIGVGLERRITRLEIAPREVARLEEPEDTARTRDAERRFTEGVASILSYGLRAAGKEAGHDEDTGA